MFAEDADLAGAFDGGLLSSVSASALPLTAWDILCAFLTRKGERS